MWAVDAVLMWGFAELTTVILAGTFPTIPRLIQWLRGQKDSPSYVQPYQKSSKPSYVTFGNDLADMEAGRPERELNFVTTTRTSYRLLEEDLERVGQRCKSEPEQDLAGNGE